MADLRVQRDVAEQSNAHLLTLVSRACRLDQYTCKGVAVIQLRHTVETEDVVVGATGRAREGAHVLHHADDRDVDLFEEVDAADGVSESEVLRG